MSVDADVRHCMVDHWQRLFRRMRNKTRRMRVPPAREATAASDRRYCATRIRQTAASATRIRQTAASDTRIRQTAASDTRIRQTAASDRRYCAPRIRQTAASDRRYSAPRFSISSSSFLVSCVLQSCVFSHFSFSSSSSRLTSGPLPAHLSYERSNDPQPADPRGCAA